MACLKDNVPESWNLEKPYPAGILIAFQLLIAFSILSGGNRVEPGLIAAAVFCFGAALVSNPAGAVANLFMALIRRFPAFTK